MAQAFTAEQREHIRGRLICGARRFALNPGPQKTSLEMLTGEAGISKSSFYKFFESKEQLFLIVADDWERQIISQALHTLAEKPDRSDRQRAADMILAAFTSIHEMGIARFLMEDLPRLIESAPEGRVRERYLSSSERIFATMKEAHIRFSVPDETVLSIIRMLYLSVLHIRQIGPSYFPALHALVEGAFLRLIP